MAFKVRKLDYRPWPVVVGIPVCDEATGEVSELEQGFVGHWLPLSPKEVRAIRAEIFGDETQEEVRERLAAMLAMDYAELEGRFFARLLCGWSQMQDEDGAALPYSADALIALCVGPDGAALRRGLNQSAFQLAIGIAPRKNSNPSPSPGPTRGEGEAATS